MKKAKTSSAPSGSPKRSSIRFTPDPGTIAWVDSHATGTNRSFKEQLPALVTEESYRGCGLVLTMTKKLQVGDKVRVKIGKGAPLKGEVRWRTDLDAQVMRIGVMYLE